MSTPDRAPAVTATPPASPRSPAAAPTAFAGADVTAVVGGVDVDAVAAAVRACPAVADLSGGLLGSAATYLPGRRVTGVVVRTPAGQPTEVDVHVIACLGPTMAEVADQVHAATAAAAPAARISVTIDDLADTPTP